MSTSKNKGSWLLWLFNDTVLPAKLFSIELDVRILTTGENATVVYCDRLRYPESRLEGLSKSQ